MIVIKEKDVPERKMDRKWDAWMREYITRDKHSENISVTWYRLLGRHSKIATNCSDRVYYIIDGTAVFGAGDEEPVKVKKGDFVLIPKGEGYYYEGDVTVLIINGPAFKAGDDKILDPSEWV